MFIAICNQHLNNCNEIGTNGEGNISLWYQNNGLEVSFAKVVGVLGD